MLTATILMRLLRFSREGVPAFDDDKCDLSDVCSDVMKNLMALDTSVHHIAT